MSQDTAQPLSIERALITRMFESDLELARDFARIKHTRAAREHIQSALAKLNQLDALADAARPVPVEPPSIDV